ncbi:diguanylate cyclase [Thiovibrio sp. JS02]
MAKGRERARQGGSITIEWSGFLVGVLGAAAVATGLFEPAGGLSLPAMIVAGAVVAFSLLEYGLRQSRARETPSFADSGLILLWLTAAWIPFRHFHAVAPQFFLLPVGMIAWLAISYPLSLLLFPFLLVVVMEGGLSLLGFQDPYTLAGNLVSYGAAGLCPRLFLSGKAYRRRVRKALVREKRDAASREYARDLGFFSAMPDILNVLPEGDCLEDPEAGSQPAVETIAAAFALQLELIRETLQVATVALLWPDPDGTEYRLRSIATGRADIDVGPYRVGTGITGALLGSNELVGVAPVTSSQTGLPYYRNQQEVGGILAVRLPDGGNQWLGFDGKKVAPILCVDRQSQAPWSEREKEAVRLAARKLLLDVGMSRQFRAMAQERSVIQRVCIALRELNGVLGLEQVLVATVKAVRLLVRVDFISISLVQGAHHRIAMVEGGEAAKLQGREFLRDEGLVGQVLKIRRPLPAMAKSHGPTQVFGCEHLVSGYSSLLVVPLLREEGEAVGALTVAAVEAEVFSQARQEILELIAAQVAVKIDLGQAHEQINRLATTDGLTGLSNHRTFQHGFDMMLKREERRSGSLSLLLCDIDYFKKINDTYGHPFGDKVLKGVAEVLRGAVRSVDLVARYGGEEFAIVLEDSSEKGGAQMAERIRQEIEKLVFRHEGQPVRVAMSLGLAVYPRHGAEKSLLIARADQALYRAKQQGRNRVVLWREEPA